MSGTLNLVATPIGNLEDITLRALRTLRDCTVVAAEDTRRGRQLLRAHEINRPLISCHQFNEAWRLAQLLTRLEDGTLLIAAPQWGRRESGMGRCLRILRSEDGGGTWEEMPTL